MVKRNNPGNIRKNSSFKWVGELPGQRPNDYIMFDTLVNGYRAMMKLLQTYIKKDVNTIDKMIFRWAPPGDNNPTEKYIDFVESKTGITKDEVIELKQARKVANIALAMSLFEHGMKDSQELRDAISQAVNLLYVMHDNSSDNEPPKKKSSLIIPILFISYLIYKQ